MSTKENKIAVLSFSGGLDSTSLLIHLLNKNYLVYTISFDYGQKHKIEIDKAKKNINYLISQNFKIIHKTINISDCMELLSSSLTDKKSSIPNGHYEDKNMKSTVVPNRNAIFISIIYGYALSLTKKLKSEITIALGVHSGDHMIYPDCRKEFYNKIIEAFHIGNWDSDLIKINLPYIKFNKSEILKDASQNIKKLNLNFNTIFKNTLTSYSPNNQGISDGKTASDIERILAFNDIGLEDPLNYTKSWTKVLKHALDIEKEFKKNKQC